MNFEKMMYCPHEDCKGMTEHSEYSVVKKVHTNSSKINSELFWRAYRCKNCNTDHINISEDGEHYNFKYLSDKAAIFAAGCTVPDCNPLLDQDIVDLYEEARSVIGASPRSSAVLLRLALEDLAKKKLKKESSKDRLVFLIDELTEITNLPTDYVSAMNLLKDAGNDGAHTIQTLPAGINQETMVILFDVFNILVEKLVATELKLAEHVKSLNIVKE